MSLHSAEPLRIEAIPPAERQAALALIFGQLPEADRQRQIASLLSEEGIATTSLDGLWAGIGGGGWSAQRSRRSCRARRPASGRPELVADEPPDTAEQLLDRLVEFLAAQGVRMAQSLVRIPPRGGMKRCWGRGGFIAYPNCFIWSA